MSMYRFGALPNGLQFVNGRGEFWYDERSGKHFRFGLCRNDNGHCVFEYIIPAGGDVTHGVWTLVSRQPRRLYFNGWLSYSHDGKLYHGGMGYADDGTIHEWFYAYDRWSVQ